MKVLHVLNHSLPKLDGYAVRSASILRFQRELGLEPIAVTSPAHPGDGSNEQLIEGARYLRTDASAFGRIPLLNRLCAIRAMAARIDGIVRAEKPEILHAHSPCLWGEAAARVARRHGLPLVYEIRGFWEDAAVDLGKTDPRSWRYRLSRRLESRVCRAANAVVTIGDNLKDDLTRREIEEGKVFVVPNGVDTERFCPCEPDRELESRLGLNGQIRIGYVGTLYPWEGVEDLVVAAPEIIRKRPDSHIFIVGGGVEEVRIRGLIRDLGVSENVHFVGSVPHDQVLRYYSVLDILVYPRRSTRNTELVTPLKPLEAMAMGKPVIGSDVGGVRELLGQNGGLISRAGVTNDLAEKCLALVNDPERRKNLGQTAREQVVSNRNWRVVAERYLPIYEFASRRV